MGLTDIEYLYQHLLFTHKTALLTGEQIRDGWLKHIKAEEESFLWVSNQKAFDLMQTGMIPFKIWPKKGFKSPTAWCSN